MSEQCASCPSPDDLSEYYDATRQNPETASKTFETIDKHVKGCENCKKILAAYKKIDEATTKHLEPIDPEDLTKRIQKKIAEERKRHIQHRLYRMAAAAAVVVIVLTIAWKYQYGVMKDIKNAETNALTIAGKPDLETARTANGATVQVAQNDITDNDINIDEVDPAASVELPNHAVSSTFTADQSALIGDSLPSGVKQPLASAKQHLASAKQPHAPALPAQPTLVVQVAPTEKSVNLLPIDDKVCHVWNAANAETLQETLKILTKNYDNVQITCDLNKPDGQCCIRVSNLTDKSLQLLVNELAQRGFHLQSGNIYPLPGKEGDVEFTGKNVDYAISINTTDTTDK